MKSKSNCCICSVLFADSAKFKKQTSWKLDKKYNSFIKIIVAIKKIIEILRPNELCISNLTTFFDFKKLKVKINKTPDTIKKNSVKNLKLLSCIMLFNIYFLNLIDILIILHFKVL